MISLHEEGVYEMPKNPKIKKVLVIGSGPIIIGQAAEFDYAGTQACRALREEGVEIVLVNSNPATIMTDQSIADKIYIEPLQVSTLEKIISKERPDSILPTLGGQTGLNLGVELSESGILDRYGVTMLGTSVDTIRKSEDRQLFKETMEGIGEPCIPSIVANNVEEAEAFTHEAGFPIVIRPAFTLGGSGGGLAKDIVEFREIAKYGLRLSRVHQILVEKSVSGWKEIEFEVMRDAYGHTVSVCDMENVDPVGVHTGDSIVVAPTQTLSREIYEKLKDSAFRIINALKIEGGCNVQFALHPETDEYAVIEVNPRVSRSSALASKAAGYPIAKIATKIAIGYGLHEIPNSITQGTYESYEPSLDYIVLKMPKWPFDKFIGADRKLGTQMKATGEVMAVSNSFESALLKAIRSLELNLFSLHHAYYDDLSDEAILASIDDMSDERIYAIAEAFRRGISIAKINALTKIDPYFLERIWAVVAAEMELKKYNLETVPDAVLANSKQLGYPDKAIAHFLQSTVSAVKERRLKAGVAVVFRQVPTSTASDNPSSPYLYSYYDQIPKSGANENPAQDPKKVLVLGSGPIRIGQGIEFDYCTVHSVWALKKAGFNTVVVNNNPETVSTDFDTADRLYFEPLTEEDVENIVMAENPVGAVVQFGGQTGIKLSSHLHRIGVRIFGTSVESIDAAEDRQKFDQVLADLNIDRPLGKTVLSSLEAAEAAEMIGYPVLVRPSYVLGGQGMEIAYNEDDLLYLMENIQRGETEYPVLIDKYLMGKEIEVDAVCDGENILIPGIMEHLERAGIHSGDSISVYPPRNLSEKVKSQILHFSESIARKLHIVGLMNVQFVLFEDHLYVIEVNPRSSRTVPFISKVTGIPMVQLSTEIALGKELSDFSFGTGLYKEMPFSTIKVPVFSFEKLRDVDISLGPEMKSTGEVLGVAKSFSEAFIKGLMASGICIPQPGRGILLTVRNTDKEETADLAKRFYELGFALWATEKTARSIQEIGIEVQEVKKIGEATPDILQVIESGEISLVVNTPTRGKKPERDGFKIRRKAIEMAIPCLTSLDTVRALLEVIESGEDRLDPQIASLDEYAGRF